jgi:hypothetical protein
MPMKVLVSNAQGSTLDICHNLRRPATPPSMVTSVLLTQLYLWNWLGFVPSETIERSGRLSQHCNPSGALVVGIVRGL